MKKFLWLFLVLLLAAFAKKPKEEEPTIIVMTPEDFIASSAPDNPILCYSCVTKDGELLDQCLIKGNINKKNHIYHCPNWRDYDKTIIDLSKGERYFYTEAEAVGNGWREPQYEKGACRVGWSMTR